MTFADYWAELDAFIAELKRAKRAAGGPSYGLLYTRSEQMLDRHRAGDVRFVSLPVASTWEILSGRRKALKWPWVLTYVTVLREIAREGGIDVAEVGTIEESYEWEAAEKNLLGGIDATVPVSARIWNYWLGGKDYYEVDKRAGDQFLALYPDIANVARAGHLFITRTVTYLAREAGVRQFLDIGTGLPTQDYTHEVAQRAAADARVVYVDNDPLVLAHARAMLTATRPGTTDYVDADLSRPEEIIRIARGKLDFGRPVAIMLMSVLGHIGDPGEGDDEFTRAVVATLKDALPSGGYLALCESADTQEANNEAVKTYNETGAAPYRLRSVRQIRRFFDGLEPVEPGVVPIQDWRPDEKSAALPRGIHAWGGVAVKPR